MANNKYKVPSSPNPGNIIKYKCPPRCCCLKINHYGVYLGFNLVISKYEDGCLHIESTEELSWRNSTIEKRGGFNIALHAIKRFLKNNPELQDISQDIYPYNFRKTNCQHFAEDCYLQSDGKGKSSDANCFFALYDALGWGVHEEKKRKSSAGEINQEINFKNLAPKIIKALDPKGMFIKLPLSLVSI